MEQTTQTTQDSSAVPAPEAEVPAAEAPKEEVKAPERTRTRRRASKKRERKPRERKEFEQRIIEIRRVTRVMAGGRRFSFSVSMVIGDQKGRVGVGIGKAGDTVLAIEKAMRDARKNLIVVNRTEGEGIPHDVTATYSSSEVVLVPSPGRGLVAGSAVRTVLELAGITDVVAKILTRSKNKLTIARATVAALKQLT